MLPVVQATCEKSFLIVHPKNMEEAQLVQLEQDVAHALQPLANQPFRLTTAKTDWQVNFERAGGWDEWVQGVVGQSFASGNYRYDGFVVAGRNLGKASAQIVQLALIRRAPVILFEDGRLVKSVQYVYQAGGWKDGFLVE